MMSEMPLPIPRSVICSPSHMMNAVPVVMDTIVMMRKSQPGSRTTSPNWELAFRLSSQRAMPIACTQLRAMVP